MNQASAGGTNTSRTTLTDKTGNGNSGTLTNFALTGTTSNWINSVSIAANATNITSGTNVIFTATPNIGTSPTYQWQKNGANIGTNSATYTNAALINGDVITCIVTSTSTCGASLSATSNSVTMTVVVPTPNALNFDGTNDYVSVPDASSLDLTSTFTFESWVYPTAYATTAAPTYGTQGFIGKNRNNGGGIGYFFGMISGNLTVLLNNNVTNVGATSTTLVPLNTWSHVAATYDGTTIRMYLNGTQVFTQALSSFTLSNSSEPLYIGGTGTSGTSTWLFTGNMDEARIWNTARSASQIANNYNCQLAGSESSLAAYYKFNQGIAAGTNTGLTTLTDATANANNGTLSNFALTGATSNWVTSGVSTTVTPSVSIAASTSGTISSTTSVTFTATPTNGGGSPTYQWKKNGIDVGTNSATYTNAAWVNNDVVTCVLTSTVACVTSTTATSTGITMSVNAVLPVELLDFKGTPQYNGNLLTWTTANEVNNKGFQVERLMDNGKWLILGFVKSTSSRLQTSTTLTAYDFTDNQPLTTSYYRLRQIDNDGKETLSKVISIERKGNNKLKAYPNPVSNILTVETTEQGDVHIFNLLGQQVLNGKATQRIDVSALPEGTYVLKVGTEQVKFVKQ